MKVGDLVKSIFGYDGNDFGQPGLVIDIFLKKVARVSKNNKKVNWDELKPEPHASVLWSYNDGTINIPISELEVVHEAG